METMRPSKTDIPCDCGYLERLANDPDMPVQFDARMNEFHFVYGPSGLGKLNIYHCPMCGGKAPESRRAAQFAQLSAEERNRLFNLTNPLKTVSDVIATLGEPDHDRPTGTIVTTPEKEGQPPETKAYRTLTYTNLSETADVCVIVYPTQLVAFSFRGKFLGDPSL
jgi:hypothetical protein